jgi:AraC family transcriptional regulator, regulatory protein of adaptative response / methylated-DNA-[protein]-cysteine methyltransferase
MSTMPSHPIHAHPVPDPFAETIRKISRRLDCGEGDLSLNALAKSAGLSPFALQRAFKRILGVTPHAYATACKLERFRAGLLSGKDVTTATYDAGFNSSSRVYEKTAVHFGLPPRAYTKAGAAQQIHFAIAKSPLGKMLVAATERGVCSIAFGDSAAELEAEFRKNFRNAGITRTPAGGALAEAISHILSQLTEHPAALALPLDLRATAFQQRVWQALMQIPRGETRSYAEIAHALKAPQAVRAVARAIATNPVAIAIPCHRVIGKDGSMTGYRWGVERKKHLLQLEKSTQKHG